MVVLDPKMLALLKSFRVTRHGSKRGGLHLLKKKTLKRKRSEFKPVRELSTTIKDAMKISMEADVFKRAFN